MKTSILTLAVGLLAIPALAQTSEEDSRAYALILPMLQELAPGYHGEVLSSCVVAHAQPEEKASLASAPGPSQEIGALVTEVLSRPETIGCVQATLSQ